MIYETSNYFLFRSLKSTQKAGFKISRQSGSHMILVKYSIEKITVVVPKHKEIAKGTLLSIISQSGMSKEQFLELL
jgi:predicted RNA binding protein YcfA (HicA-like mRNA interferase family)